ncbi:MAG: Hsp20/alpha crystallin family protein [Hyphomicrobiales bacterium]|uniref:Hsp20/alpha crystallin family protein n=1 Tax=Rhabdaerophilum calidifontis TaxID=2604328 RepID=UPI00123B88FA|nr:Hsp20/alpha crystallin family protein [Rhabdaerophilum calidifontis]MCA1951652.1 Hsp20/alpha crystallin family protein [Hyphomicrobiales bacterium]MCA1999935.1 Hsp20/alpha crystallin family protein [Hyphomicrobiales bacterium]
MDFRSLIPTSWGGSAARGGEADPFSLIRREMDRVFETMGRDWPALQALGGKGFLAPKVDVAETGTGLELTAELPGIDQKDIELDLTDGVLTLKAEHRAEKEEKDEKKHYHLVERARGTYLRRFTLPFEPDEAKIEAHFDKGVLKVVVPRSADPAKPARRIEIRGG